MELDQKRARLIMGTVLAVALFGGGIALGHSTTSSESAKTSPVPAPPASTPNGTGTGATPASGIGPARVVSGVPVGYPHSKSGALSAAANYSAALGSPRVLTPEGRAGIVSAIAAPASAAALQQQLERSTSSATYDQLRADQGTKTPIGLASVPISLQLDGTGEPGDTATVQVYAITYVASSTATAAGGYGRATVKLAWSGGDWKLTDFAAVSTTGPISTNYYAPSTGWLPVDNSSLYDVSSNFRRALTEGTVPGYVVP
ncbi:hypothetical protein ACFVVA_36780 [Kitasatospora sp. NPDC058048]|uniref:hypothetical protein n=1 Tax=Kitasatospora sp. NPDC058048 TaxID=3346313 RepID=UPI0036D7AF62